MTTELIPDERDGKLSASAAERVWQCPASLKLHAKYIAQKEQSVTVDGTVIHEAMETDDDSVLEEDQLEIAEKLRVNSLREFQNWCERCKIPKDAKIIEVREERYWIRDRDLNQIASAKLDVAYIYNQYALIQDYKTGYKRPGPASTNKQLLVQTLSLCEEYPDSRDVTALTNWARLTADVDITHFDWTAIQRAKASLLQALWEADRPDPRFQAGRWCDYCNALPFCRHAAAYAVVVSPVPDRDLVLPDPNTLSVSDRLRIHKNASLITKFLSELKASLKALPKEELEQHGWGLTKPGIKPTIDNPISALGIILNRYGEDKANSLIKISFGDVVDLVHASDKSCTEKQAKQLAKEMLSHCIRDVSTSPRLKQI